MRSAPDNSSGISLRTFWQLHALRDLLYFLFAGLLTVAVLRSWEVFESDSEYRFFLWFSVVLCSVAWTGWVASGLPPRARRQRIGRIADILVFNTILLALLLETLLAGLVAYFPNPLLWDQESITGLLESNLKPYRQINGFTANSQGYHDQEFFPGDRDSLVVALLGDSFAYSVVSFSRTFATLAERRLQAALGGEFSRIAVHNFGVPAIGMPQYTYLLSHQVLPLNPRLIVLAVFVGNDIEESHFPSRWHPLRLDTWRLAVVSGRVLRWWGNSPSLDRPEIATEDSVSGQVLPDFVDHPEPERPTFPEETFLEIERSRIEVTHLNQDGTARAYAEFFTWMDRIRGLAGDKLVLMLIPDEFQVNDRLWEKLLEQMASPGEYLRDSPQQRILEYAGQHEIPTLDLLPLLRSSEKRTYHLRDTHLNGLGNRLVGDALGAFLLDILGDSSNTTASRSD